MANRSKLDIRRGTLADVPRALEIWRSAVDSTHRFLSPEHRAEIDVLVREQFLPNAELWLAVDDEGSQMGWLVMDGDMIDALFVDPAAHGLGYGSRLLDQAALLSPSRTLRVEASEQATNALPFYLARGFRITGRTPTDHDGRPYPLVQLVR
jgi:putative acetyltransferase